jgi:hypothetical protein
MVSSALSENGPDSLQAWKNDIPLSVAQLCEGRIAAASGTQHAARKKEICVPLRAGNT